MATANSIATNCACMRTRRELLEQHQLDVEAWARHIIRDIKPSKRGFVACPPFPVLVEPPRGRTSSASKEASHD
jgi:hypothetical protein